MDGYFDKSSPKTLGFLENLKFVFLSTPATQGRRIHRNKMITAPKKDKNSLSVKDALVISVSRPSNKKSTNLGLQAIAVLGEFVELLCGSPQEGYMVAFTLFRYSSSSRKAASQQTLMQSSSQAHVHPKIFISYRICILNSDWIIDQGVFLMEIRDEQVTY